jgi:hypothetical protein
VHALVRGLHQLFRWTRQTICFEMCASPISLSVTC